MTLEQTLAEILKIRFYPNEDEDLNDQIIKEVQSLQNKIHDREDFIKKLSKNNYRKNLTLLKALHDGPLQRISSIILDFENNLDALNISRSAYKEFVRLGSRMHDQATAMRNLLQGEFQELSGTNIDLILELRELIRRDFNEISIQLVVDDEVSKIPFGEAKKLIISFVQEALVNSRKHGKATKVVVKVSKEAKLVKVCIVDNGVGIHNFPKNVDINFSDMDRNGGVGLKLLEIQSLPYNGRIYLKSEETPPGFIVRLDLEMQL